MVEHGFPEPFVAALMARYAKERGQAAPVTDEAAKALGRPALTFADWAAEHAAAFQRQDAVRN
jgi:hypothetical protein